MKGATRKLVGAAAGTVVVALSMMAAADRGDAAAVDNPQLAWARASRVHCESHRQGMDGNLSRPAALVANDAEEWDRTMARLWADGGLLVGPPEAGADLGVDWKRNSVVLVGLGEQTVSRYRVSVSSVRRRVNQLLLDVRVELADPDGVRLTSPYHMVLVPHGSWASVVPLYHWAEGAASVGKGGGLGRRGEGTAVTRQAGAVTWAELKDLYR